MIVIYGVYKKPGGIRPAEIFSNDLAVLCIYLDWDRENTNQNM